MSKEKIMCCPICGSKAEVDIISYKTDSKIVKEYGIKCSNGDCRLNDEPPFTSSLLAATHEWNGWRRSKDNTVELERCSHCKVYYKVKGEKCYECGN